MINTFGDVITFYSYKGGVGRTFTLANTAAILAHWGFKVLCVDWDIEAPGLHYYFPPKKKIEHGLHELVEQFTRDARLEWRKYVNSVNIPRSGRRIDIIYASADARDGVLVPLDWDRLYKEKNFGDAIETLRDEWKRAYDFVFIDSRTGVSDGSAICTVQLPDNVIFLLTANDQSLKGSIQVMRRSIAARQELPVERTGLRTLPIVSRFDGREEYDLAVSWKGKLTRELDKFYTSWVPRSYMSGRVLEQTTIPYIARWSFGEEIVGRQEQSSPQFVSYYFANIAAIIANRFQDIETLIEYRESYINLATAKGGVREAFAYDIFISAPREWMDLSRSIAELLRKADFKVFDVASVRRGRNPTEETNNGLVRARNLVVFSGDIMGHQQITDLSQFIRQTVADLNRRIVPVYMSQRLPTNVPELVKNFRYINGFEQSQQYIAGAIAAEISSSQV